MWLAYAFSRLILPLPVNLKRFFAPLLDFIFGMAVKDFMGWSEACKNCRIFKIQKDTPKLQ